MASTEEGMGRRAACRMLASAGATVLAAKTLVGCGAPPPAGPDAGHGCTNVGPASAVHPGSPVFAMDASGSPFYVVRDSGGIYALSAVCTHLGCTVNAVGACGFTCPCHGSTFDESGNVTGGPAPSPLVHYLCTLEGANVCVDTGTVVPPATRL